MDTVLQGRSKTVIIGSTQPFCIIGERINPTGRKKFAEELRAGDLSTVVVDTEAQMAAGADVLDINAGIPLVDEAELLAKMIRLVQEHTDAPICIDSSVIEALEAGLVGLRGQGARELDHRRGRPDGGDPPARRQARRRRDRPGQRRDRHPRDRRSSGSRSPRRSCQGLRRLRHPARGRRDRPARDDGRRRHRGRHHDARGDAADPRQPRREHVPRRVQRVLRPPAPARAQRRVHPDGRRPPG